MFNRKCKITFISHGATVNSEENRLSDKENYPPLNASGHKEIEKICEWLNKRALKNDKIYSSPALRTIQSAGLISKVFKKDFEILEGLYSRKYGVWSGLTFNQIEKKHPQMLEQLRKTSYSPEKGEKLLEFNKRIAKIIKNIVNNNTGNRIIIVTHPEVIQAATSKAIKLPPQYQSNIYIKTGSATQISYFKDWASLIYSGYVPL